MNFKKTLLSFITFITIITSCNLSKHTEYRLAKNYKPDNQKLYDTIVKLDHIFFEAYNTCNLNLDKYGSFFSENIEFYHDRGGLMTSKQDLISATQKNICGKVTRELVKRSIEVYPIKTLEQLKLDCTNFIIIKNLSEHFLKSDVF